MRCASRAAMLAAASLIASPAAIHAQECQPALYNGGFEIADPLFPFFPDGWGDVPPFGPRWRAIGDDPFNPPLVRSGSHSIELPTVPGERFLAWTTNVFGPTGDLFDPPYEYGGGPITVSGWYAIPAGDPLVNARAGLKLEFRRTPPNFSIYLSFERLDIHGHTNGKWVYYEMTITQEDFDFYHDLWGGPWPPFPTSVSVLPLRFLPTDFASHEQSGTIFWDDLRIIQTPPCRADMTGSSDPAHPSYGVPDGKVDANDFFYFIDRFQAGDPEADLTGSNNPHSPYYGVCDGVIDAKDFFFFLELFALGC